MNPAHRRNTFTPIGYSGDAERGAIEWIWTAKHSAPFLNLPADGKETRIAGASVMRFGWEDSRATRLLGCENGNAATGFAAWGLTRPLNARSLAAKKTS